MRAKTFKAAICTALITGFAALAVVPMAARQQPRMPTFHGKNGRIVWKGFVFADFTTSAIYTSAPNGKDIQQLTFPDTGIEDDLPKWSPDGSKIICERSINGEVIEEM